MRIFIRIKETVNITLNLRQYIFSVYFSVKIDHNENAMACFGSSCKFESMNESDNFSED